MNLKCKVPLPRPVWFQGYDIALATNENVITLRVADLAGNVTMTNFTVILDYTSAPNAPEVAQR